MDRQRQASSTAAAHSAAAWLALVVAFDACGGQAGHEGTGFAEQTGGVVDTSSIGGLDTAQAGSGASGRSAAGGTGGATSEGSSGGAATGGAGTPTGGTASSSGGASSGGTSAGTGEGGAAAASGGAPLQGGAGGTGGKESAGSGGRAAGGSGAATGETSSSAGAAGSAGAVGPSGFDELLGTWEGAGYSGDCVNERQFLTFEEPDQVSYADWNDDACSGPALMGSKSGTFVSGQHTLLIDWDFIEDPQDEATAWCFEEYPFAMGVSRDGTPGIVRDLFIQLDDRTWQYRTLDRCYAMNGVVLESTLVHVELSFDAPVPLTGSDECQMTVSAWVARESKTTDDSGSYAADLYIVPCVVEPEDGKQHFRFAGFADAEPAEEYAIWMSYLDEQGYQQAHPDWVLALLNGVFFPDLTLDLADPTYLCEYDCTPEWVASEGMTVP
jgi:hypothetical protein